MRIDGDTTTMTHRTLIASVRVLVLALGAAGLAGAAQAQSANSIVLRGGVTRISPDVKSGDLSAPSLPGTTVDIKSSTRPTGGVTWFWTDNISLDVPLAFGFKHDIVGTGAIEGVGKIGEVKALPITLLAQYRFMGPDDMFRPYVGAGPTYAKFYDSKSTAALSALTGGTPSNPTTLSVESKLTVSFQVGVGVNIDKHWGIDLAVLKTPLKTRTTLSTGQTIDTTLDPWSYTAGVSYRF